MVIVPSRGTMPPACDPDPTTIFRRLTEMRHGFTFESFTPIKPAAFTLVELLVVVTIIVMLLAMLTPALDEAVYQAELAVCGATMGQAARGVIAYGAEGRRAYPYRPCTATATLRRRPHVIKDLLNGNRGDDRDYLRAAWGTLDVLLDPLSPKIDLDNMQPDAIGSGHYGLWFGMKATVVNSPKQYGQGMFKLGDRLEFIDHSRGQSITYRSAVLISDWDMPLPIYENNSGASQKVVVSHPDKQQRLYTQRLENSGFTASWWTWGLAAGSSHRPATDLNFATADGAVVRYTAVEWNDDRMAHGPYGVDNDPNTYSRELDGAWNHLPKQ